jgi:hypothetical protein
VAFSTKKVKAIAGTMDEISEEEKVPDSSTNPGIQLNRPGYSTTLPGICKIHRHALVFRRFS